MRLKSIPRYLQRTFHLKSGIGKKGEYTRVSPLATVEKTTRAEEFRRVHFGYGYSFAQITGQAGLHYETVSRIVRKK